MRVSKITIIIGIILIFFGAVFLSQGRGQLGPESSFMYYDKDWVIYGMGIIIVGIITSGFGVFVLRRQLT
ncbi:MAG: hypothetical protein WAO91_04770 [Candidatus Nitrosotenuis sp.]